MENKLAMAILGKGMPVEKPVDETKEAMTECANGIMKAIEAKDTLALKEHLYSFLELFETHEENESPEEEKAEEL